MATKKQKRKQVPINFNMEDPREEKMYNWFANQTSNISGMMKAILFEYMERKLEQERASQLYQLAQLGQNIAVQSTMIPPQPPQPKKKRRLGSLPGVD